MPVVHHFLTILTRTFPTFCDTTTLLDLVPFLCFYLGRRHSFFAVHWILLLAEWLPVIWNLFFTLISASVHWILCPSQSPPQKVSADLESLPHHFQWVASSSLLSDFSWWVMYSEAIAGSWGGESGQEGWWGSGFLPPPNGGNGGTNCPQ